jgi:ABC-type taurine transport system ATPase subunit
MDDPLQHNDVLHAAAFADLLRNLVRERGYQVFLSTHDAAQAEFLRRKFAAGGVPCTSVQLLGRGKLGVGVDIKASSVALATRSA